MNGVRRAQPRDLIALGAFGAVMAAIALALAPFSMPTPKLFDFAQALAWHGRTPTPFFAVGYIAMMAAALRVGGLQAIFVAQALLYVLTILLTYSLLSFTGARRAAALAAAIAVGLEPYQLVNIKRIVDSNLDVPLLLAVTYGAIWAWRRGGGRTEAIVIGLLAGLGLATRGNYGTLLLLTGGVFVMRRRYLNAVLTVTLALAVSLIAIAGATGHWRIAPTEGGYTFFLGANPFTAKGLLRNLNPEGAGGEAFAAYHFTVDTPDFYAWCNAHEKELGRAGLQYAVAHPLRYLGLGFLKLFTLFRPDYRMIASSKTAGPIALFVVQTAIALVCPVWLVTRLALRREVGWFDGTWAAPVIVLLLIPMFLVAADPRYREPISILAIADTVWCWDRWLCGRAAPGQTSIAGDAAS